MKTPLVLLAALAMPFLACGKSLAEPLKKLGVKPLLPTGVPVLSGRPFRDYDMYRKLSSYRRPTHWSWATLPTGYYLRRPLQDRPLFRPFSHVFKRSVDTVNREEPVAVGGIDEDTESVEVDVIADDAEPAPGTIPTAKQARSESFEYEVDLEEDDEGFSSSSSPQEDMSNYVKVQMANEDAEEEQETDFREKKSPEDVVHKKLTKFRYLSNLAPSHKRWIWYSPLTPAPYWSSYYAPNYLLGRPIALHPSLYSRDAEKPFYYKRYHGLSKRSVPDVTDGSEPRSKRKAGLGVAAKALATLASLSGKKYRRLYPTDYRRLYPTDYRYSTYGRPIYYSRLRGPSYYTNPRGYNIDERYPF